MREGAIYPGTPSRVALILGGCPSPRSYPGSGPGQPDNHYLKQMKAGGNLFLSLKEPIGAPLLKWPRTLLRYPIRFDGLEVRLEELHLTHLETGKPSRPLK